MNTHLLKKILLTGAAFVILLSGCRKEEEMPADSSLNNATVSAGRYPASQFSSELITPWYNLLTKLITETPGHTPPIAAREIGYTGITLYEAVTGGLQGYQSLAGQLNGLSSLPQRDRSKSYVPTASANAALARIIKDLYGNISLANSNRIDSLESANDQAYAAQYSSDDMNRARDFGRAVADAIFIWSTTDGGDQAYLRNFPASYIPPTGVEKWIPTPPLYQSAML